MLSLNYGKTIIQSTCAVFGGDIFCQTNLKSWSLTFGKSLMSIPMFTVVSVLFGREFLKKKKLCNRNVLIIGMMMLRNFLDDIYEAKLWGKYRT